MHYPAVALLSQMVTASGARNVVVGDDLVERVRAEEPAIAEGRLKRTLAVLESETKLVRRERRRNLDLYEISSEFLVPWIGRQRADRLRARERAALARRQRRLLTALGGAVVLVALMAGVTNFALTQRQEAQAQARRAHARQLDTAAVSLLGVDPGLSLLLASEAARKAPSEDAEDVEDVLRQLLMVLLPGAIDVRHRQSRRGRRSQPRWVTSPHRRPQRAGTGLNDSTSRGLHAVNHGAPILAAAISPDGRFVVTGGKDGRLELWGDDGRRIRTLQHRDPVRSTSFSRDGNAARDCGGERRPTNWAVDGELIAELPWSKPVTDASFSPDGRLLVVIGNHRLARLYDTRDGTFCRR